MYSLMKSSLKKATYLLFFIGLLFFQEVYDLEVHCILRYFGALNLFTVTLRNWKSSPSWFETIINLTIDRF